MEFSYDEYAEIVKKYIPKGESILDLACGTGTMIELLSADYHCIGSDLSEDMLEIARFKNPNNKFYVHDLIEPFSLPSIDNFICTVDSLNYILNLNDVESIINNCTREMKAKGYLIFDIYSDSKLKTMDNYSYELNEDDLKFKWISTVKERLITHYIDIELDGEIGREVHKEYVHQEEDVDQLLKDYLVTKHHMEDRIIYVCHKK